MKRNLWACAALGAAAVLAVAASASAQELAATALAGKRIGVMRPREADPAVLAVFDRALDALRAGGAQLVELEGRTNNGGGKDELVGLLAGLKSDMGASLAAAQAPRPDRGLFAQAQAMTGAGEGGRAAAPGTAPKTDRDGLDRVIAAERLDAVVAPAAGPAPDPAALARLTVPIGEARGLPVALAFIGRAASAPELAVLGDAYARRARAQKPSAR